MIAPDRDPGLDTLLDLHGQTLFVDEAGHWVKFVVVRTEVTPETAARPQVLLTLHAPDGEMLVGLDNAHPFERAAGSGKAETRRERPQESIADGRALRLQGCRGAAPGFWSEWTEF